MEPIADLHSPAAICMRPKGQGSVHAISGSILLLSFDVRAANSCLLRCLLLFLCAILCGDMSIPRGGGPCGSVHLCRCAASVLVPLHLAKQHPYLTNNLIGIPWYHPSKTLKQFTTVGAVPPGHGIGGPMVPAFPCCPVRHRSSISASALSAT